MKIYNRLAQRGFTLIELLVVIAIIGLLASVVLASVNSARARSRDAARVQEMNQIKNALELYYSSNKHYPQSNALLGDMIDPTTGVLKDYIKSVSATFSTNITQPAKYVPINGGAGYEIYTDTETGGAFKKNIGCSDENYAGYEGVYTKLYCLGMNAGGTGGGTGDDFGHNRSTLITVKDEAGQVLGGPASSISLSADTIVYNGLIIHWDSSDSSNCSLSGVIGGVPRSYGGNNDTEVHNENNNYIEGDYWKVSCYLNLLGVDSVSNAYVHISVN